MQERQNTGSSAKPPGNICNTVQTLIKRFFLTLRTEQPRLGRWEQDGLHRRYGQPALLKLFAIETHCFFADIGKSAKNSEWSDLDTIEPEFGDKGNRFFLGSFRPGNIEIE